MTSDTAIWQRLQVMKTFFEEGDIFSLVILSLFFYYACACISDSFLAVHRTKRGYQSICNGEPRVYAFLIATIYLVVHFATIAQSFDREPIYFVATGIRCFFASRIVFGVTCVLACIVLVITQRLDLARRQMPNFVAPFVTASEQLRARFGKQQPEEEPEPQETPPTREELARQQLDDARLDYESRSAMLNSSGLDETEQAAVRQHLKQQYLRKMRSIMQQK